MGYQINTKAWSTVFAVPSCIVDEEIRLAGAVQLKVLLWILRNSGRDFKAEDISASLGISPADVTDAIQYWCLRGLLLESEPAQKNHPFVPENTAAADSPAVVKAHEPRRLPRPDNAFIAKRTEESPEIAFLMQEAQVILGRALSPSLSGTLLMIHDDYGLPADVILMILQYAKMKNRDHTSYIDTIGRNWADEGINTHELAEQKLTALAELEKAWGKVRSVLRLEKRSPSKKEEQFAEDWIINWKFSDDMIREAYDRCIDSTGKMSMSYMNKILEKWHAGGIRTPMEAAAEGASRKKAEKRETTYDLDEFENLISQYQPTK